jgi:retron-type reverse transcriptase
MRTHKNLFLQVTAFSNLYRAFLEASHGKRNRPEVQRFEYHLEERLWEIKREPEKRRIKAGRGTLAAVRRYEAFLRRQGGRGYVLKADIRQYFPSVDQAVLRALLRRKIGDERLLRLLDGLIASGDEGSGKGMPIGNLTSQLFANLYLDPLDHFVKETLRWRFGADLGETGGRGRRLPGLCRLSERLHAGQTPQRGECPAKARPVRGGARARGGLLEPCSAVHRELARPGQARSGLSALAEPVSRA